MYGNAVCAEMMLTGLANDSFMFSLKLIVLVYSILFYSVIVYRQIVLVLTSFVT